MALFSTSSFAKCQRVGEDGPGRGHLCHTDTFLVIISLSADNDLIVFFYASSVYLLLLNLYQLKEYF